MSSSSNPIRSLAGLLLTGAICLASATAYAESFATRPIKLVVPTSPGGVSDIVARAFAAQLSKQVGQPVVVENRAGASGAIGAGVVATAAPDGLTICFCFTSSILLSQFLPDAPATNLGRTLVPVTSVFEVDSFVVAKPDGPKSLAELIATAKKQPGKLSFGSPGTGGVPHLGFEMFSQAAGLDMIHVPYKGDAPMTTDFLAGILDIAVLSGNVVRTLSDAGKAVLLANMNPQRNRLLPNVPTIAEQGYPNVQIRSWYGLFVPPKTPDSIVQQIYVAARAAVNSKEFQDHLLGSGLTSVVPSTPGEFANFVSTEEANWKRVVDQLREGGKF